MLHLQLIINFLKNIGKKASILWSEKWLTMKISGAILRLTKVNTPNRWCGDNGNDASTENPWCWESGEKQVVKWTAEGAGKDFGQVFCDVWAYVSCREYAGTPSSARLSWPRSKVAPRIGSIRPWQKCFSVEGVFVLKDSFDSDTSRESFSVRR